MRNFFILTILLLFAFGMPNAINAKNDTETNASKFCMANNDLNYSNHGKCVSILKACENLDADGSVCVCKEFLNNAPEEFYVEYNNLVECISHLEQGFVVE